MRCPNCNVDLVIADRMGIEIDYCPRCRGVWLDRGELDKVIDRAVSTLGRPGTHDDRDDDRRDREEYERRERYDRERYERPREPERHHDDSWKHKRKKSFLGELFDFD